MPTDSTLPPQAAFHHAILRHLAQLTEGDRRGNIHEALPDLLQLTAAQRSERLANLSHLRYRHRSGWSLSMLKAAGYVESPAMGIWRITQGGRDLLARFPNGFDQETARRVIREGRRDAGDQSDVGERDAVVEGIGQSFSMNRFSCSCLSAGRATAILGSQSATIRSAEPTPLPQVPGLLKAQSP